MFNSIPRMLLLSGFLALFIATITFGGAHVLALVPPVANDDSYSVHGLTTIGSVLDNDVPPPGGGFSGFGTIDGPHHGTLEAVSPLGKFVYRPNVAYTGTDTFTYTVCSGSGNCSNQATVTLSVNDQAPVAGNDAYIIHGPLGRLGPIFKNDHDPDGDPFSFNDNTPPQHGLIETTSEADRPFYRTAVDNFVGYDFFTYNLIDSLGSISNTASVAIFIINEGDGENAGAPSCNSKVGCPINVTNGNMFLQQTDYVLPGVGPGINVTRTYNSSTQVPGLFGRGWTSVYDEHLEIPEDHIVSLVLPDGRTVHSGRTTLTTNTFNSISTNFYATTVANSDGTYTVTFKDGSVHQFNSSLKLTAIIDRNNNQTTLGYTAGKLSSITDSFGRVVSVTSDIFGRITQLSDASGVIAIYAYDGTGSDAGALHSVTYPDGSKYTFSHVMVGSLQLLATVTDVMGHVVEHHEYDSTGRATTSERQNGIDKYTLTYTPGETDVTDAEGHLTKYTFQEINGRNFVTKIEGTCGCGGGSQVQEWSYDNIGNPLVRTNALGELTTSTFDSNGNPLTVTDLNGTSSYTYNQFSELLTATDPMGGVATITYDSHGNPLTVKDALNHTTTFTSNSLGQIVTVKDARTDLNDTTMFNYGGGPNLLTKTDALGHVTTYTYFARGWLKSVSDPVTQAGSTVTLKTEYEYDAVGRPTKVTYPDTKFIQLGYDAAGRRISVTDARGNATTIAYDDTESSYRVKTVTDPLGHSTTNTYTLMSRLASRTDALMRTTNYEYDEFMRLKKVIYPPETTGATRLTEQFTDYDNLGRIKTYVDTAGRTTTYDYNDVTHIDTVTDPAANTTKFEFNQRRQLVKVTDALNQVYVFAPDALGRITSMVRGGQTMGYLYDEVGNRTQRTDYNGAVTNYSYDGLNRLTAISYPNATTASYGYDQISRLVSAANQTGTVSFVYDNRSRVVSTTDVMGQTIAYNYDENSNRKSMTLGSTVGITYDTYDAANRLRQMTDNAGGVYSFDYDNVNRPTTASLPNGVSTTYNFDGLDRLTELKNAKGAATINDFQYSYNTASDVTQIAEPTNTRTFGYDPHLDRLTSVGYTTGTNESYAYDAVGNWTSSHLSASYRLQPFNKIVSTANANYTYDNNGNMISRFDAAGRWCFNWDAENRLVRVVKPGWRPVSYRAIVYTYDALGRRVERSTKTGGTQSYTFDGQDVVLDQNGSGAQTTYINGPGIDNKLKLTNAGTSTYFSHDHLGSTTALTNASGAVTSAATYDGYGRQTGALATRYGYTGRELDPDTGLMFYRARWYDSTMGRFISEDPSGFGGGDINLYGYSGNNPLSFLDPMGLCGSSSQGWGSSLADKLDFGIGLYEELHSPADQPRSIGDPPTFVGGIARGFTDLLRVGDGLSGALDPNKTVWERSLSFGHDILRVVGIAGLVYGPAEGVLEGAAAACIAEPTGEFYSVAFETELESTSYPGVSRAAHNQEANSALMKAMESDPQFAVGMKQMGIELERTPTGLAPRRPPTGWTWHHATEPGTMQLVPFEQHAPGSIFQQVLHPGGRGGYFLWGQ